MKTKKKIKNAFTIVELLTVISIIALIIGLLVPALNQVNRIAKDTKQKAQFHAITTGLEMFKTENERLPSSNYNTSVNKGICGAHKLAEALVGRDLQGYDPLSDEDNPDYINNYIYSVGADDETKLQITLDRRKGPYLTIDNASAFDVDQIYKNSTLTGIYNGTYSAPVITDIYKATRVSLANNKTANAGTPILYYRADISKNFNDESNPANSVYNIDDNDALVKLGTVKDNSVKHKIATDNSDVDPEEVFYEMIANEVASASLATGTSRPYKPDSYILISAGYDGVFGTNDDITNFEE